MGYECDQVDDEDNDRRVADTFRVISLSLSNVGGTETLPEYFSKFGNRSYEDRIYFSLGEHYLGKLRYDDAAKTYKAFVALYPFDRAAPRFSMRVVDTFAQGGFPKLVLESKREFASKYGLKAEYWTLQTVRVAGSTGLSQDEPERPRDALSRPVSERKRTEREAHELSRGKPMVRRLPRVLPEGSRFGIRQLSACRPAFGEQGFWRGGHTV